MIKKHFLTYLFPLCFLTSLIAVGSISTAISVKRQREIHYISSEEGLKSINNDLSGHYIIDSTDSITLSSDWIPIGDIDHPFTGILDCNYINIYCTGFDSAFIDESANSGEVLLGLFAVNKGTIKHVGISFLNNVIKIDSANIQNDYNLICGSACAINYGYVSMCFVNSTPQIEVNIHCKELVFGGITGINYKQVRCCSVTNAVNLKSTYSKIICGGIVGISDNDSVVEYCIRNGFLWVYSLYKNEIICGQCIGVSKGGQIDNISITSNDAESYKTFSYINCPNAIMGGLVGVIDNCALNIFCININTSFEMRNCSNCSFGFLFGLSKGSNLNIDIKNIVISGTLQNEYLPGYSCGYICSDFKEPYMRSNSIFSYDVHAFFQLEQKDLVFETDFASIGLKDVKFDSACWKKGQYSFILDIEKMK